MSGEINKGPVNTLPQVWQTASGQWRDLANAQEMEPISGDLYPRMFLAPDGLVFRADPSPNGKTWYLDASGLGAWIEGPRSNFARIRSYGSAAMYEAGKILSVGGGDPPTNSAEVIDLNEATPQWRAVSPMASVRRYHNATLLPDGNVLVIGGTRSPGFNDATDAVLVAEMWDSKNETWTTMAAMQHERVYHSTAILLPDGRVLAGGGGRPEPGGHASHRDFEIYSPPYLFKGTRPAITSAPAKVTYGQTFVVKTPDAMSIADVTWIRLPSVTHAFDQNQRLNRLRFLAASGALNVTAPDRANLCPPGHYMLFILNGDSVPSAAKIIQIIDDSVHTAVKSKNAGMSNDFRLGQNYPNPFNPTTTIEFDLPKAEFVALKIYNTLGAEVTTLVSENLPAGQYRLRLDAGNLASGIYLYKLQAESFVQTKKMILVR
jgi:hypothetical protein